LDLFPHHSKRIDPWRLAALEPAAACLLPVALAHAFRHRTRTRVLGLAGVLALLLLACVPDERPVTSRVPVESVAGPETTAATPRQTPKEKVRGLWILAEGGVRVLDDATRIDGTLDRAERLGATDLFVQVYRGGRAFYAGSDDVERAPSAENGDTLAILLAEAHRRGFRVHAWVNALSLSTRRDAALIERLGRDAILVDREGRSILDYPDLDLPEPDRRFYRMGTRGIYLDPAVPAVREYLVTTYRDLVTRYPQLDGLHLDYIRHPGVLPFSPGSRFGVGLEFGYGETSRARYRAETGRPDPIDGAAPGMVRSANVWDAWRRDQVTRLVEEIAAATRAARPGLVLSAAVISYVDRAYLSLAQDWRRWLEMGALDLAIPMVYTLDDRLLGYQLDNFAGWKESQRIWPGIGVWLFDDRPHRALGQLEALRTRDFGGEVLFSDDAIAESPGLLEALAAAPPGEPIPAPPRPAPPPTDSTAPIGALPARDSEPIPPPRPATPPRPASDSGAVPISSLPLETPPSNTAETPR
jgi:uncharacterized lipoprotein YddW (UPF0748 family)